MFEFNALTCIDLVANLVEVIQVDNKTAAHVSQQFSNVWLSGCPKSNKCLHNNGGEFTGAEFQELLQQVGIQDVLTMSKNPTANAIYAHMHQTIDNTLTTQLNTQPQRNCQEALALVEDTLAVAVHAASSQPRGSCGSRERRQGVA